MLGVGWTLNYEMLFYLLATIALLAAPRRFFALTTTGLVAIAWMSGCLLPRASAYGSFLSSPLVFEFTLGILAWNIKDARLWEHIPPVVLAAAAVMFYALMAWLETVAAPYPLISNGIPAFLIVVACFRLEPLLTRLPPRLVAVLVHIGDASYATYLSHLYFVDFGKRVVGRYVGAIAITSIPGTAVIMVASLLGGSLVYLLLDKPAVRGARSLVRSLARSS
jgi:peptidoglycan/LPS O-acetylase OafA/YrhL